MKTVFQRGAAADGWALGLPRPRAGLLQGLGHGALAGVAFSEPGETGPRETVPSRPREPPHYNVSFPLESDGHNWIKWEREPASFPLLDQRLPAWLHYQAFCK